VKIHHFDKRAPRKATPRRDGEAFAGAAPTVPELKLKPPRLGGAAAEPSPLSPSSKAAPAPAAKAPSAPAAKAPPAPAAKAPPVPPAQADSASARTELEVPVLPQPAPPARGGNKRSSRKSRTYAGPSPSPRAPPPPEEEPAPGSVAERLATSRRLFGEGNLDEAGAVLERLVSLGIAPGPVHTQLGAIYLAQGAIEQALERFEEALLQDSEDLSAMLYRGAARLARGDLLLAVADLQHVLDLATAGSPLVEQAQQLLQLAAERKRS
jgi:hypothetical protein